MAQRRDIGESPVASFLFPVSRSESGVGSGAERGETALTTFLFLGVITLLCHRCVRDRRRLNSVLVSVLVLGPDGHFRNTNTDTLHFVRGSGWRDNGGPPRRRFP